MEEHKIMSITSPDGSIEEVEIVVSFEFTDTKKEYVVYTKNEKDENGNITLYVSYVNRTENAEEPVLETVETEEEWSRIKDLLRELAKDEEQ